jgi:thiol-disulfide isomerase/thioredoxin
MELNNDYTILENNMELAKKYINEPFLWEPLFKQYQLKKKQIEAPLCYDNTLKDAKKLSFGVVLESILDNNRGKVIYIDCWATWCAPCKAEMPETNAYIKEMNGKDIAFVFICLDSPEKHWLAEQEKLNIGGQHYLFSKEQSKDFRNTFKVNSIPFYMVLDKKGNVIEKGNHLSTHVAKKRINELLQE